VRKPVIEMAAAQLGMRRDNCVMENAAANGCLLYRPRNVMISYGACSSLSSKSIESLLCNRSIGVNNLPMASIPLAASLTIRRGNRGWQIINEDKQ